MRRTTSPVRILHVDDAEDAGQTAEMLEREDERFEVATEPSASDGLERLATGEFDCVVGGYRPSGIDGVAFLERVRSEHPDLPFVLFTGERPEAVAHAALDAGATDYVRKTDETATYRLLATRIADAVEQCRTERERDRYRTLVETVGDSMFILAPDGTVTMTNEAMAAKLDCGRDRIVGSHADEFMAEGDFERGTELIADILRDPDRDWGTYEVTVERHSGGRFPAEINVAPVLDETGEYEATVGVVRDITDRKRHEQRLSALHDTTRTLVDATDFEEAVTAAIEAADEVLDLNITSFYAPEEDGGDEKSLVPVAATDDTVDLFGTVPTFERGTGLIWQVYEHREALFAGDVSEHPDAYNPETPVRSEMIIPAGDHGVFVAASTDPDAFDATDEDLAHVLVSNLTHALDSVRREERLRERERRLQRENDRLETFTRIVSHDLRNPLNLAHGRLRLAREECDSECLTDIERALDRMETITEDMLTLAREGSTVEEVERVPLDRLASGCWGSLDTVDATLNVGDPPVVAADPDRLRHVFENLYGNAIEHGGAGVTVTVDGFEDGFYVADDGPGIPPGERERVFESGYSTTESGTGFGLEIVEQIVEAHGWSVRVAESEAGGARFEITDVDRA